MSSANFSKKTELKFDALGYYQIIGGIIGIGVCIWLISLSVIVNGLIFIFITIFTLFYSHSIYAGLLLLKRQKIGLSHSFINQLLQIFSFTFLGFGYKYFSGLHFTIAADMTNSFELQLGIGFSSWEVVITPDPNILIIKINIVALFVLIFVDKLQSIVRDEINQRDSMIG